MDMPEMPIYTTDILANTTQPNRADTWTHTHTHAHMYAYTVQTHRQSHRSIDM